MITESLICFGLVVIAMGIIVYFLNERSYRKTHRGKKE